MKTDIYRTSVGKLGEIILASKKEYRNAIRSRRLIRAAFVELMHEKPFEKITATDIINRSGLNRSTFYAHYPDVKGILDEITTEIVKMFEELLNDADFATFFDDPEPLLIKMQQYLLDNEELYRWLSKSDMSLVKLEELKQILIRKVLACSNLPAGNLNELQREIGIRMMLGGVIDVFRQWLNGEICCTQEELTAEVMRVVREMRPV